MTPLHRAIERSYMAEFLDNFGLSPSEKTGKAIYYRGTDPVHHVHDVQRSA